MRDHTDTDALAQHWLDAMLVLIQKDPKAAKAAIDTMEDFTQTMRPVLALKFGENAGGSSSLPATGTRDEEEPVPASQNPSTGYHGLTRNQLSKVRGVYLMEALMTGDRHHTLGAIVSALKVYDFRTDEGQELTEAAVRSHLHRLKKAGHVSMIGSGVYELTDEGYGHLKRERAGHEVLLEKFRAAMEVA